MARLKDLYEKQIKADLASSLGIKNPMALPRISKITVNAGVGRAVQDSKKIEEAEAAIIAITGQKTVRTVAKKSIAGFKIREKMPIGVMVTLRGERMYEFLDVLVNAALPRVRDFRGINGEAFDGHGNYSLGVKEHTVFPQLIGKDVTAVPFQVNIQTTAKNDEEAKALLKAFNFPFRSNK
jgi:large subunit ribosomal protein L5